MKNKSPLKKINYLKKLQILREMPYELLHYVIKHNNLFDYINTVEFFASLKKQEPIKVMETDLNILKRNNKIFKFKTY